MQKIIRRGVLPRNPSRSGKDGEGCPPTFFKIPPVGANPCVRPISKFEGDYRGLDDKSIHD